MRDAERGAQPDVAAPGAVTRLIDMGVEPFLISSSLMAVLALVGLMNVVAMAGFAAFIFVEKTTADYEALFGATFPPLSRRREIAFPYLFHPNRASNPRGAR